MLQTHKKKGRPLNQARMWRGTALVVLLCWLTPAAAFGPRLPSHSLHPVGSHSCCSASPRQPTAQALRTSQPCCVAARFNRFNVGSQRDPLELDDPDTQFRPEELLGPWELKCTISGFEDMWVELHEDGSCSCSSKVGRGVSWYAERIKGRWRLRVVLSDKLKRPLTFEGSVRNDDDRGTGISGSVLGPPKLLEASRAQAQSGVVVGEFAGWHNV